MGKSNYPYKNLMFSNCRSAAGISGRWHCYYKQILCLSRVIWPENSEVFSIMWLHNPTQTLNLQPHLCWQGGHLSLCSEDGGSQVYHRTVTSLCPDPPHLKWPVCWSLHFTVMPCCSSSFWSARTIPYAVQWLQLLLLLNYCFHPACGIFLFLAARLEHLRSTWSRAVICCRGSSPALVLPMYLESRPVQHTHEHTHIWFTAHHGI